MVVLVFVVMQDVLSSETCTSRLRLTSEILKSRHGRRHALPRISLEANQVLSEGLVPLINCCISANLSGTTRCGLLTT